jgi:CRISPR-associated protein Cmr3
MADALKITPADIMMFRDGRPFNQDDPGGSSAISLFPPPPPTVVGAIRLAVANQNGFRGNNWPKNLLGSGVDWQNPDSLGKLKFGALRLIRRDTTGTVEDLFPAPAHLVCSKQQTYHLLAPMPKPAFLSDLDDRLPSDRAPDQNVHLATCPGEGLKTLEHDFVTGKGMQAILHGKPPETADHIKAAGVYSHESRVGIAIEPETRVVKDGALYIAGFVRLNDALTILQPIDGLPDGMPAFTQRFGGEHRVARFEPATAPKLPNAKLTGTFYAAIAVTPVFLKDAPLPGGAIAGLPGTLVTACTAKPFWLGGWDSQKQKPLPMRQIVPAGAVFFMKCDENKRPVGDKPLAAGSATQWGFGHCLAANWPVREDKES